MRKGLQMLIRFEMSCESRYCDWKNSAGGGNDGLIVIYCNATLSLWLRVRTQFSVQGGHISFLSGLFAMLNCHGFSSMLHKAYSEISIGFSSAQQPSIHSSTEIHVTTSTCLDILNILIQS